MVPSFPYTYRDPLHHLWFKVQPRLEHTRRDTGCGKTEREMQERRKPEARKGNS